MIMIELVETTTTTTTTFTAIAAVDKEATVMVGAAVVKSSTNVTRLISM